MSKPKVLFVCIGNSCRSQMAEGWARQLFGAEYDIYSAGSRPAGVVDPFAVQAMREKGIDISSQASKAVADVPKEKYEMVVTMGCGDSCPQIASKHRMDWQIPDPVTHPLDTFREVRDRIEREVRELFGHLQKLQSQDAEALRRKKR